jgi:hypothetical protein
LQVKVGLKKIFVFYKFYLRKMAIQCRRALNSCDLPEYCDGKNPSCPADFFVQDGYPCPDGALEVFNLFF